MKRFKVVQKNLNDSGIIYHTHKPARGWQSWKMFLKIWLCPTHSSIVGPERIFHGGMRIRTCTAQTYPVGDRGDFFPEKNWLCATQFPMLISYWHFGAVLQTNVQIESTAGAATRYMHAQSISHWKHFVVSIGCNSIVYKLMKAEPEFWGIIDRTEVGMQA